MEKVRITGIGNQDEFNFLIAEKNKDFFEWLGKVMYNSFEAMPDVVTYLDDEDNYEKEKKKKIENYTDWHESFEAEGARIDIFYGKEKVFITVITSLKNREKLMGNLEKYSEFVE